MKKKKIIYRKFIYQFSLNDLIIVPTKSIRFPKVTEVEVKAKKKKKKRNGLSRWENMVRRFRHKQHWCTCKAAKFQPGSFLMTHSNTLLSLMALSQGFVPIRLTLCEKSHTNMTWTLSDWQLFREKNVDVWCSLWKVCQAMQLSKADGSVQS